MSEFDGVVAEALKSDEDRLRRRRRFGILVSVGTLLVIGSLLLFPRGFVLLSAGGNGLAIVFVGLALFLVGAGIIVTAVAVDRRFRAETAALVGRANPQFDSDRPAGQTGNPPMNITTSLIH